MGTPATAFAVDQSGYLLVSEAADCQILTRKTVIATTVLLPLPTPFPQDTTMKPSNLPGRRRVYVKNNEVVQTPARPTVYIGGPGISTTTGYPLVPGEEIILDVTDDIQLYAIVVQTDTVDLRTAELA